MICMPNPRTLCGLRATLVQARASVLGSAKSRMPPDAVIARTRSNIRMEEYCLEILTRTSREFLPAWRTRADFRGRFPAIFCEFQAMLRLTLRGAQILFEESGVDLWRVCMVKAPIACDYILGGEWVDPAVWEVARAIERATHEAENARRRDEARASSMAKEAEWMRRVASEHASLAAEKKALQERFDAEARKRKAALLKTNAARRQALRARFKRLRNKLAADPGSDPPRECRLVIAGCESGPKGTRILVEIVAGSKVVTKLSLRPERLHVVAEAVTLLTRRMGAQGSVVERAVFLVRDEHDTEVLMDEAGEEVLTELFSGPNTP